MTLDFVPGPPRSLYRIPRDERRRHLKRLVARVPAIIWQALTPYEDKPTQPSDLPQDETDIPEAQVAQCEWIFDQAEQRATALEQKAQWTFGLIAFLAPLLAGAFVLFLKELTDDNADKGVALGVLSVASILLLLGFICALRGVSVRRRETLFLQAVLNENGGFRAYSGAFRARGLLYCASMNTAMNDHIANFVKAAHIFSAMAVVALVFAAIPASLGFSSRKPTLVEAKISAPVTVTSKELGDIGAQVASLRSELNLLTRAQDRLEQQWSKGFDARMTKMENEIAELGKALAALEANRRPPAAQGRASHR